jgi:cation/acetate symporter
VGADREGGAAARGATILAGLVLLRFNFNPLALFAQASATYGPGVLAPGRQVTDPIDAIHSASR